MADPLPRAALDLASLPLVTLLGRRFAARGFPLFLIGGSVRSMLLGRDTGDLDFTTAARPEQIESLLEHMQRQGDGPDALFAVGKKFGTIGAIFGGHTVEITTFRSETYQPGSRKPEVEFGDSLRGDVSRRDFTINALAVDATSGELFDFFGGLRDLDAELVRAVGDAGSRFLEDPLRLLRAVRVATQLRFRIEPATLLAVKAHASHLTTISRERIAAELNKLLVTEKVGDALHTLCTLGLMEHILPEVLALQGMRQDEYHHKDVYEHTLQVVEGVPPQRAIRLGALLHDIAKPRTRSVDGGQVHFFGHERVGAQMARSMLTRLHYDAETIERVTRLVELHLRANAYEADWTDGAVRRFMREAGEVLEELLQLSRADVTTSRPARKAAARRRVDELQARVEAIRAHEDVALLKSPLDGNDLMTMFGRPPGPWIKKIKDPMLELVFDGALSPDDRETAAEIARRIYRELFGEADA